MSLWSAEVEEEQIGKGVLLEMMTRVYGPAGFKPGDLEQVTGRFNESCEAGRISFATRSCSQAIGAAQTR